ncbi:MAG: hypothetical protein RIC14_11120 [Filomicrobium sp.]
MNDQLDTSLQQKILDAILRDVEIRQLVLEGTVHYPVAEEPPTMPYELGYCPMIMRANLKAKKIANSFVRDLDPLEYAFIFLEARRRIAG